MNTLKMLLAEIGYRKLNFALSLFAVTVAVALLVTGSVLLDGHGQEMYAELESLDDAVAESAQRLAASEAEAAKELAELEDETRRVMRDMGFNLTIVHRDADIREFLADGFTRETMPQDYVERLAADENLTMANHLVATLQEKVTWGKHDVLLVGYLPETPKAHQPQTKFAQRREQQRKKKLPMGISVEPGSVHLGYRLGIGRKPGETVEVLGRTFRIAQIDPEKGDTKDITIAMHLQDAQALLDKPGLINQILAIDCRCSEAELPRLRKQVRDVLPDTYVLRDMSIAEARAKQRKMVQQKYRSIVERNQNDLKLREQTLAETRRGREKMQGFIRSLAAAVTPLAVLAAAVWVGLLALANVRERRSEIGILRAIGKGAGTIAALFLGKAMLLGLLGAAVGFLLGTGIGFALGTDAVRYVGIRPVYAAAVYFSFPYAILPIALVGAALLSAVASYLPTRSALVQDPAVVLRDQ